MRFYKRFFGHLCTTTRHKWYVFVECCRAGIPMRGILHDLSKFSPVEFWESVKYYQRDRSPVAACKEENGYSKGWMHHKGRNSHHYEYWQDNFDHGGEALQMPFTDALEMVCDYIGACKAYEKGKFSYTKELRWWVHKCQDGVAMHPQTQLFVTQMLLHMVYRNNDDVLRKDRALAVYRAAEEKIQHLKKISLEEKENWKESLKITVDALLED